MKGEAGVKEGYGKSGSVERQKGETCLTTSIEKKLEEVKAALQHPKSDDVFAELCRKREWCQARLALAASA